jgi:hypothetical protein
VPIPGYERFEFRDPFGNRVEFIQAVGVSPAEGCAQQGRE